MGRQRATTGLRALPFGQLASEAYVGSVVQPSNSSMGLMHVYIPSAPPATQSG